MSYSGSSSSDYYSSLPLPPTSTNRKKGRRSVNSFNESSIDSYFRDEGYFSYCGNNTTDSRRTSVSFANLSSNEALDTVEIHEPYFNRFTNAIKDFIHSAQNIRLPRYSSSDSIASLDPDASKPAARFYGRECYSSDSSPESNNKVRFGSPRLGSSSEDSGDGVFMNHHGSNNAQRDKLKTRRISIVEPPVTAFFNNGSPIDQQLVRKVHSMRDAPKSILKKCSVKSEGHNSALQDTKYHIYEVIPEELFRYGEQRPDPRPPLPERPLIRSMAIFPPEYMFQPRSHHAYHRRNAVVID
ncbi:hypothetical protein L596_005925 [Steinernema carpocapsae]|uniref:Uncharacterized protein n=1 Tax=Steinernema carpocapsae TaxID=34508 RepID=A0A4U8V0N3_STECR|nr:hypothetical protein L596_005925 [Steinernema carpocapsae]